VLICLASFTYNYYRPFFFEATATVNHTSLLVLTTMLISVMESLPRTAYIKLIDVWLIVNLCIPFVVLVLHTYMEANRADDQSDTYSDSDLRDSEMDDKAPGIMGMYFNRIFPLPKRPVPRPANERTIVQVC
jgi:hypothetical protein